MKPVSPRSDPALQQVESPTDEAPSVTPPTNEGEPSPEYRRATRLLTGAWWFSAGLNAAAGQPLLSGLCAAMALKTQVDD